MTNYESGKMVAQTFSHDIGRLLEAIYVSTIEPKKGLSEFEMGVLDEVSSWQSKVLGFNSKQWLLEILKHTSPKYENATKK